MKPLSRLAVFVCLPADRNPTNKKRLAIREAYSHSVQAGETTLCYFPNVLVLCNSVSRRKNGKGRYKCELANSISNRNTLGNRYCTSWVPRQLNVQNKLS